MSMRPSGIWQLILRNDKASARHWPRHGQDNVHASWSAEWQHTLLLEAAGWNLLLKLVELNTKTLPKDHILSSCSSTQDDWSSNDHYRIPRIMRLADKRLKHLSRNFSLATWFVLPNTKHLDQK